MEDASQQRQDTSPRKEDIPAHSFADVKNAEKRARQYERQRAAQQEARREQQIGQVQTVRRRRRHRNYIIYYILLGTIMTIVCITLSLTVFFNIEKLNPTGSSVYSSEEILAAVNARKGDNLIRLNVGKLESQALETLTSAESVEIKRHFPNQLDIVVTDGEPVLQVSFGGMFYQFTESGRLIGVTETAEVDGQVVVGPDPTGWKSDSICLSWKRNSRSRFRSGGPSGTSCTTIRYRIFRRWSCLTQCSCGFIIRTGLRLSSGR